MAQVSPPTLQRPPQPSPIPAPYADSFAYHPQPGLSEPNSSTSQLPYDPIADRKAGMAGQPGQSPMQTPPNVTQDGGADLPKAFACSTCQKGFARRSDLVRTVEESAAARAAALASRANQQVVDKPEQPSEGEPTSDASSAASYNPYMAQMQAGGMPRSTPYQAPPPQNANFYSQGPSPAPPGPYAPPRPMAQAPPQPDGHPDRFAHPTPPQANMPWAQPAMNPHPMQQVPKMEGSQPTQPPPQAHPAPPYAYQPQAHGYYQNAY
ncbi:MAG: hypothetical protein Q9162_001179 [Coniocarpon cinnabarinum]